MAQLTQKTLLLAKAEATYGTDPTPTTAADAVQVFDVDVEMSRESLERPHHGVSMSRLQEIQGKGLGKVSFYTELKHSGTKDSASDDSPILQSCGLDETINAGTSVVYQPDDTPTGSCTFYVYKDGLRYIVTGARGNVTLEYEAGQLPKYRYEMQGRFAAPTDVSFPTSATLDSTKPIAGISAAFTWGGYSAIIQRVSINMNNELAENLNLSQAKGLEGIEIVNRNVGGTMLINAVLEATETFWADVDGGTTNALSIAMTGSEGNIVTVTAPKATIKSIKPTDESGVSSYDIEFQLAVDSGGDELVITNT